MQLPKILSFEWDKGNVDEAPIGLHPGYLLPALRREQNPSEAKISSRSSTSMRSRFSAKGDKSYQKNGVSPKEAEEVFVSEELLVLPDRKHSQIEKRHIALGKTQEGKNMFVVFTLKGKKMRIVSARKMHQKEVRRYRRSL